MILSETCTACKQEVRTVAGTGSWKHREPADHNARFGRPAIHPHESRQMRDAWLIEHGEMSHDDQEAHVEPIPDPELRAEEVADDELPSAAGKLARKARSLGWEVTATRSRGPWLHSTNWTTTGIYDLVLLRLRRDGERAVATWRSDKAGKYAFLTAWAWTPGTPSLLKLNSTELRGRLEA